MVKVKVIKDVPWLGNKGRKGMEISIYAGFKASMIYNGFIAKDEVEEAPAEETEVDQPKKRRKKNAD